MVVGTAGRRGGGANMAEVVDALVRSWKDRFEMVDNHEAVDTLSLFCQS